MRQWTKEIAIQELDSLISQIEFVASSGRGSDQHIRWWTNTSRILEEIFGRKSVYYITISSYTWTETGTHIYQGWDINSEVDEHNKQVFLDQLQQSKGLLLAAKDHLIASNIVDVYQGKDTAPESSVIIKILSLIDNKLRKLIREKPDREKVVQDAFENLLILTDIQYERENPSMVYSTKKYIPDFSFPKLDLIVEIKLCTETTTEKQLIPLINDDILAYQTKFGNLIFVVYDIGQIRDATRFSRSFENTDKVIIKIVKH
ncbi:MAG: hypothetical protein M0Q26_14845 [Chitinophagaceae bacterium]|nr:hypothetical protein [Chitinophagaceae bacterium]